MSQLRLKQILDIISSNPQPGDYFSYNSVSGKYENTSAPLDGTSGTSGNDGTKGEPGDVGPAGKGNDNRRR